MSMLWVEHLTSVAQQEPQPRQLFTVKIPQYPVIDGSGVQQGHHHGCRSMVIANVTLPLSSACGAAMRMLLVNLEGGAHSFA